MKMPIEVALNTGKIVEGSICYTGDILDPNETKYTLDYYIRKAKELEAMGCHIFAIKDMAGLLKPYAAKELFSTLKKELHIPLHPAYTRYHRQRCQHRSDGGRGRRGYC